MKSEAVHIFVGGNPSLSVRRAWIEIKWKPSLIVKVESLSVRRAWIEIS